MLPERSRVVSVGRAVVHEIRTENVTFLAGSIAYHAFVSLLPLLLLVVLVLSSTGNAGLEAAFESLVRGAITENAGSELLSELERAGQSSSLSLVGLAVLLWGALRIFRGLDTAFSDIYETEAENSFLDQLADGLLLLAVFAVAVVLAALLRQYLPSGGDGGVLWPFAGRLFLVAALTVALLPMYYVFPDTDVGVVEVLPGTVFAAVGLTAFESLFQLYAQWGGTQQNPSVVAAVLVFLTWLYFSGLVVLVGASVNAVLSNRSADVAIDPVVGGTERGADRPTQDAIVRALTDLESALSDPADLTVTVGDRSVTFPPPQRVSTDTEPSMLDAHDLGMELRWAVDSDGRDGDGTGDGDVERTVEVDRDGDGSAG